MTFSNFNPYYSSNDYFSTASYNSNTNSSWTIDLDWLFKEEQIEGILTPKNFYGNYLTTYIDLNVVVKDCMFEGTLLNNITILDCIKNYGSKFLAHLYGANLKIRNNSKLNENAYKCYKKERAMYRACQTYIKRNISIF